VRSSLLERLEPARLDLRAAEWVAPNRYELRRDARRFEEWEQYDAGKIGLARAIDYVLAWDLPAIWERVHSGGEWLRELLRGVEGVTIQDPGAVRCGIVTFTVAAIPAEQVKEALAREQITVSVALAGHAVVDARERGLPDVVRASVHYFNTDEELERTAAVVAPPRGATKGGA
jgi:cysteine desulfurase / selenocysteine lyase